ncbi:MAG TPA: hypothetical protein VNN20_09195 [Thermodesulfobacteriota bacterium]|nr:hypothetical protein [Thermodesulfobacteriota bacterium]
MTHPRSKASQWFLRGAWWLYGYLPDGVGDFLKKHYRYLLPFKNLRITVSILRGKTHLSSQEVTILFANRENAETDYMTDHFFDGQYKLEIVENVWSWNLASTLRLLRQSTDLTIARIDRVSARLFFSQDYIAVPEWVCLSLPVSEGLKIPPRRSRSLKDDLRIVRRSNLHPHYTQNISDFDTFYNEMYVPSIQRRYGEKAYIRNFYQLRRSLKQGGLLWVMQNNKPIAGLLFKRRGQLLQILALGTLNGERTLVKTGALTACYLFIIEHASKLGCELVDFGGCRPLLNDGLLRYKRKWGMIINEKHDTYYDYLVYINNFSREVISLLSNNPLIFRDNGGLSAISLMDGENPAAETEVERAHHYMWIAGLRQLYLVSASGWKENIRTPVKTRLVDTKTLEDCKGRLFEEYHDR